MYKKMFIVGVCFSLLGCAQLPAQQEQAKTTRQATRGTATIHVRWVRSKLEAHKACSDAGAQGFNIGCAFGTSDNCTIIMAQPADFNDIEGLTLLGHETWHCLGAKHE